MPSRELARFLRDRRADLRPADVGLPQGTDRRTPGLRREEVADLANMSVDYYARLEQARGPRPSPRILDALTGALRLTDVQRAHLFRLAGTTPDPPAEPVREVRPYVLDMLHRLPGAAAIVTDATYDVIGWNPLAGALLRLEGRVNLARRRFLEPHLVRTTSGQDFGAVAVARLRAAATRYPHDVPLRRLLAELRAHSPEFVEIWDSTPLHAPGHRRKTLTHPDLGVLHLNCDAIPIPDDDQQIVFVTADPTSPSAAALRRLAGSLPGPR